MPILKRPAELQSEVTEWRRHLHQNPEILFAVENTAAFVERKLKGFGVDEIVTGLDEPASSASFGAVSAPAAPSDSGPTWTPCRSPRRVASPGPRLPARCMPAATMAILLGAAQCLSETRKFAGGVALIFQPAEEGGGGGNEMVKEGMMERFAIEEVYGMHNMPGMPVGQFGSCVGPIMASAGEFTITIKGRGGHAAQPHKTIDPIAIGAQIVNALQTIASRMVDPLASVVVSVTKFNAGSAHNVIPEQAVLPGTMRALTQEVRDTASSGPARSPRASPAPMARPSMSGLAATIPLQSTIRWKPVTRLPPRQRSPGTARSMLRSTR